VTGWKAPDDGFTFARRWRITVPWEKAAELAGAFMAFALALLALIIWPAWALYRMRWTPVVLAGVMLISWTAYIARKCVRAYRGR
jgi:hypothetical protein